MSTLTPKGEKLVTGRRMRLVRLVALIGMLLVVVLGLLAGGAGPEVGLAPEMSSVGTIGPCTDDEPNIPAATGHCPTLGAMMALGEAVLPFDFGGLGERFQPRNDQATAGAVVRPDSPPPKTTS
jgi:hypothetical protein